MDTIELDAAMAYEALYVPALFEPWAQMVADNARLKPGNRVLDVACGTGALTRVAADRVGPTGSLTGLDADAGMLAVAARTSPEIQWRQGSGEALPFPDGTFDVVVSQFGLMFFADPGRGVQEMIRVLAPGGRLVIAVWDLKEHSPIFAVVDAIYLNTLGESAREALDAPFVFGEAQRLLELLTPFCPDFELATRQVLARFPSAESMVRADLEGWMPRAQIGLKQEQCAAILMETQRALAPFTTPSGRLEGKVSAHIVSGVKP
jgi:SAM-dependent methyltransferase